MQSMGGRTWQDGKLSPARDWECRRHGYFGWRMLQQVEDAEQQYFAEVEQARASGYFGRDGLRKWRMLAAGEQSAQDSLPARPRTGRQKRRKRG